MIILFQCQPCAVAPETRIITVNGEPRHLVTCPKCGRMTLHYYSPDLAGAEWNTMQTVAMAKK